MLTSIPQSLYRGEEAGSHPPFPKSSKAAIVEFADGPIPDNTPPIEYTKEDDKVIEQYVESVSVPEKLSADNVFKGK